MTIVPALIHQVQRAAQGGSETDVTTYITRPLWRAFNRELGHDENVEPTEWLGIGKTHRVYGSRTVIVESEAMESFSRSPHENATHPFHKGPNGLDQDKGRAASHGEIR